MSLEQIEYKTEKFPNIDLEKFEANPIEVGQKYLEEIIDDLNKIYDNDFEKPVGVVEGYSLKEHTEMVVYQFTKYYQQFKTKLPDFITPDKFIQILAIHDIGKVDREVQELKESGAEKKEWKKKEEERTKLKSEYILKNKTELNEKQRELVLEILTNGAAKIGGFVTGYLSVDKFSKYIRAKSQEYQMKPKEFLDFLETYFICDASAYTDEVVDAFKDKLGESRYNKIKALYMKDSEKQQPGAGITDWFSQENGNILFRNNQRFGDHKMKDWLEELRGKLEE